MRAKFAIEEYDADLIVPLDADEFLYHIDGKNPREVLEELKEYIEYQIPWRTYVYEKEPDIELGFMPNNFTHYRNPSLDCYCKTLVSKLLIKEKLADFAAGCHSLKYPKEYQGPVNIEKPTKLVYAHFPLRSKAQLMNKVIPNWIYKWKVPFPIREKAGFHLGNLVCCKYIKNFGNPSGHVQHFKIIKFKKLCNKYFSEIKCFSVFPWIVYIGSIRWYTANQQPCPKGAGY